MLARIKFASSNSNRLNEKELKRLGDFLGEKVESSRMKIVESGEFDTVSWRETFDKEKVEKK
jgi:hypothetical protein